MNNDESDGSNEGGSDDGDDEEEESNNSSNNEKDILNRDQLLAQIQTLLAQIEQLQALLQAKQGNLHHLFTQAFKNGDEHSDVKALQQKLNQLGFMVSTTGAGSLGQETNYYGPRTTKAIQKFQCKYGIVCGGTPESTGYGNFGPKTRAKLGEV